MSAPEKENWKEIVPTRPDVMLNDIEVFEDFYTLVERENGLPQLTIVKFADGAKAAHHLSRAGVHGFCPEQSRVQDQQAALCLPIIGHAASVFDYDVEKHTSTLLKQTEVPGGYDPSKYQSERVWATAKDGVKVPDIAGLPQRPEEG